MPKLLDGVTRDTVLQSITQALGAHSMRFGNEEMQCTVLGATTAIELMLLSSLLTGPSPTKIVKATSVPKNNFDSLKK